MRVYSPFFSTIHDETGPVGNLGRGTHYSIFRAVVWEAGVPLFHDFACIWDEDHDTRIVWVIEQLFARDLLKQVLAIGERKGGVTVITAVPQPQTFKDRVTELAAAMPGDEFAADFAVFPETDGIVDAAYVRTQAYLLGITALWQLGPKPCEYYREKSLTGH